MSEERECAAEVVSALLRGKLQGQQMVFRVVGIRPLVHESESCEQVHAGLGITKTMEELEAMAEDGA